MSRTSMTPAMPRSSEPTTIRGMCIFMASLSDATAENLRPSQDPVGTEPRHLGRRQPELREHGIRVLPEPGRCRPDQGRRLRELDRRSGKGADAVVYRHAAMAD